MKDRARSTRPNATFQQRWLIKTQNGYSILLSKFVRSHRGVRWQALSPGKIGSEYGQESPRGICYSNGAAADGKSSSPKKDPNHHGRRNVIRVRGLRLRATSDSGTRFDVGLPRVVSTNGSACEAPSRDRVQPALSLAELPTGKRCRCNSSSADRRSCGYYQVIGTCPG